MKDIALFPIPNCVAFPGTLYPLHVFEPRYRQMVNYCVEHNVPIGICHTEALISPGKRDQSLQEALTSDQATYKPFSVFSAGPVEIKQTLPDGRLLIEVHLNERLKAIKEKQSKPFMIFHCETYQDHPVSSDVIDKVIVLKRKILKRLLAITADNPPITTLLASPEWQDMATLEFSFRLFGLLHAEGDIQQQILQCRSPLERLNIAWQLLNR